MTMFEQIRRLCALHDLGILSERGLAMALRQIEDTHTLYQSARRS